MLDGMGSSGHVVGRLPVRILETSLSLRGMKEGNDEPLMVAPLGGRDSWSNTHNHTHTHSVSFVKMLGPLSQCVRVFVCLGVCVCVCVCVGVCMRERERGRSVYLYFYCIPSCFIFFFLHLFNNFIFHQYCPQRFTRGSATHTHPHNNVSLHRA